MKKKILYIIIAGFILGGCAKDDTTFGGTPISEITISFPSFQTEYNLEKNSLLTIEPVVSQSIDGQALTYQWEVEHSVYSNERVFSYPCLELGTFNCRLIVSNEDGKTFAPFIIHVNTPYEEGITIISKDPTGKSRLSFMLNQTDKPNEGFYQDDIFTLNNPEIPFASNVSDVVQSSGNLIISCQGDGNTPPVIYYLNEKTMEMENYVEVSEYTGFSPLKLLVCSVGMPGASYPIVSSDGKIYDFASTEGTVVESSSFPSRYEVKTPVFYDSGNGANYNIFLWDEQENVLVTMFNGYGGYYCLYDFTQKSDPININDTSNLFGPGKDQPIAMFIPSYSNRDLLRETPLVYIISESNGRLRRTAINKGVWAYDMDSGRNYFDIRETLTEIGRSDGSPLIKGAPMVASNTNKRLFFAHGNQVYQWYYPQGQITTASVFARIGGKDTIIKDIALSEDQASLYVAAYSPSENGLNGSCHIIEIKKTDTTEEVFAGEIISYNKISYEPVKILYKKK